MEKYDAMIILGEPVERDGTIGFELKSRIDTAMSYFRKGIANVIILSGGKTSHNKLDISEAEGMKRYLVENGLNQKVILKEEYSKDTIGNALFTKTKVLDEKKYKKLLIVTSDYHIPRARYIFKKILGKGFKVDFIGSNARLSSLKMDEKRIKEHILLALDKVFMNELHMFFMKE